MKRFLWILAIVAIAAVSCSKDNGSKTMQPALNAVDYSDMANWFQTGEPIDKTLKDVFYLIPTAGEDWTDENGVIHHMLDVNNPEHREAMISRFNVAYPIFGERANFFSPYYRQITLQVWEGGKDSIDKYYPFTFEDVKASFNYYMKYLNGGREFILAGFSQGAKGVKELMKIMTDEEFSRMKAAYVIGFPILQEDIDVTDHFVPAQGAEDTGVTISYSSVDNEEGIGDMFRHSKMIINPANWSTGTEVAQVNNVVTNYINKEHMMLFVDGVDPASVYQPAYASLFPYGNFHLLELPLYKEFLRENVKVRLYGK